MSGFSGMSFHGNNSLRPLGYYATGRNDPTRMVGNNPAFSSGQHPWQTGTGSVQRMPFPFGNNPAFSSGQHPWLTGTGSASVEIVGTNPAFSSGQHPWQTGVYGGSYRGFSTGGGLPPGASPPSGGFGGPQSPSDLGQAPAGGFSTSDILAPGQPKTDSKDGGWSSIAAAMQLASVGVAMIGAIGQKMVDRILLKTQADALKHQEFMASINARQGESDAQAVIAAGHGAFARVSAEAGQVKAKQKTSAAARGVEVGVGSSGDVLATTDVVKSVDKFTINTNAVRQAGAVRMGAINQRNAALMARVGAGNLRRSAGGISPGLAGVNIAMAGVGEYAWNRASNYGYRRGNNAYRQTGVS